MKKRSQPDSQPALPKSPRKQPPRCNALDGKAWLRNSISLWSDIRKTPEEAKLKHPAMFPVMLADRLIESFLPTGDFTVLDPFCGSGSTLISARQHGLRGIGCELADEYVALARQRLEQLKVTDAPAAVIHHRSATELLDFVPRNSVDLCVTSPPYWNILNQRRTADAKSIRHYGNLPGDLGVIDDYAAFLDALAVVFEQVFHVLKPGAYCGVVVMDLRKRDKFYPFHTDLATRLQPVGFQLDDLIIWNRQSEYNNLRPLGYPAVFRVNKVHEFIVLLRKPKSSPLD